MDTFMAIVGMIGTIAIVTVIVETIVHYNLLSKEDQFNG
jgi:hypothetical protein